MGPHQLRITTSTGLTPVNSLTFHVLGSTVVPFPSTAVLDEFPTNGTSLGGNWRTLLGSTNNQGFRVATNSLSITGYTFFFFQIRNVMTLWSAGTTPAADQEAYATVTKVGTNQTRFGLALKNGALRIARTNTGVDVLTTNDLGGTWTTQATYPGVVPVGAILGARTLADGTTTVYVDGTPVGPPVNVTKTASPWLEFYASNGGQDRRVRRSASGHHVERSTTRQLRRRHLRTRRPVATRRTSTRSGRPTTRLRECGAGSLVHADQLAAGVS